MIAQKYIACPICDSQNFTEDSLPPDYFCMACGCRFRAWVQRIIYDPGRMIFQVHERPGS